MIALQNAVKIYGRHTALHGVSVAFQKGQVIALLGPNGSGKTTMIKMLLGLVRPTRGSVNWYGKPVGSDWAFKADIGYMPQMARFPEHLRVDEFLSLISDLRPRQAKRREALLELFDLSGNTQKKLRELSGGMRQKVCAVMALMFDVPMYILDEPTAGLDPLMARRVKDILLEEKKRGKTILLTSHIMGDIEELADRIVVLLEGIIIFDGSVSELNNLAGGLGVERAVAALIEKGKLQ